MNLPAPAVDHARLARITHLDGGSHDTINDGACIMEAVAYISGEPWSDHPECACPIISSFLRAWNDALPHDERDALLLPLLKSGKLIGTRGSAALEHRRSLMAADWLVRVNAPAWLRLAGLTAQADALATLPEITSMAQVPSIRAPIEAAQRDAAAAWAAAWAGAGDAAWDAAWAAAWAAAGDAARAAAGDAAWAAAWDAARDAAGDAAGAAARAAAKKKLAPTKIELQQSALALVDRMIAANDDVGAAA